MGRTTFLRTNDSAPGTNNSPDLGPTRRIAVGLEVRALQKIISLELARLSDRT
jgi:hypothetical protein